MPCKNAVIADSLSSPRGIHGLKNTRNLSRPKQEQRCVKDARLSGHISAGLCTGMATKSLSDAGDGNRLPEKPDGQGGGGMGAQCVHYGG